MSKVHCYRCLEHVLPLAHHLQEDGSGELLYIIAYVFVEAMASRIMPRRFTSRHLPHLPRLPSLLLTSPHFTSPPPSPRATHLTRPRLEHALGWPRACLEHASSRALLRACFEFSGGRPGWLDCRASSMPRARLGDVHPPGLPRTHVEEGPGGLNNILVINKCLFITQHLFIK